MTCIVNFKTKKQLKEHVATYGDVDIHDPSIFQSYVGRARNYIKSGRHCTVTNHPKRSWFAQLVINSQGKLMVK